MRNDHCYGALQDSEEVIKLHFSVSFILKGQDVVCDKVSRLGHDHTMSQRLTRRPKGSAFIFPLLPFRRLLSSPASKFQVPTGNAGGVGAMVGFGSG